MRRSGGFAGITRTGSVELDDSDPVVAAVQAAAAAGSEPGADRFVYHVTFDDGAELAVPESALSPDVRERVEDALG